VRNSYYILNKYNNFFGILGRHYFVIIISSNIFLITEDLLPERKVFPNFLFARNFLLDDN